MALARLIDLLLKDITHPAPDYAEMRPYNKSARTRLPFETDGQLVPDRRVAEMIEYSGFVDVAQKLYTDSGDEKLLRKTATDDRIDQTWVSAPLEHSRQLPAADHTLRRPESALFSYSHGERTCSAV